MHGPLSKAHTPSNKFPLVMVVVKVGNENQLGFFLWSNNYTDIHTHTPTPHDDQDQPHTMQCTRLYLYPFFSWRL